MMTVSLLADIFPFDLVPVVQRGTGDEHSAHIDRDEIRHGGRPSQAADLDDDAPDDGRRLLGWKLPGDRPARRTAVVAQTVLPVEAVDLHHDAVDGEAERGAAGLDRFIVAGQRRVIGIDHVDPSGRLVEPESPLLQLFPGFPLGPRDGRGDLSPGVGEEAQGTFRGHLRIQLAQAAGGGVPGIGEPLPARTPPAVRSAGGSPRPTCRPRRAPPPRPASPCRAAGAGSPRWS